MKHILISIKPEWVEKILNGDKTIEIRKTRPKCELPCKVYIYCTKGNKELRLFNQKVCISHKIPRTKTYSKAQQKAYTKFIGDESQSLNSKVVAEFTLNKVEKIIHLTDKESTKEHGCWQCKLEDKWKIENGLSQSNYYDPEEYSDYYTEGSDDNYLTL